MTILAGQVTNGPTRRPSEASEWIVGAGYISAILVIPGFVIAAYLRAHRNEHAPWVFAVTLFFLAFWIVVAILGGES
jgi:uncharacterized membrane protein YhdT